MSVRNDDDRGPHPLMIGLVLVLLLLLVAGVMCALLPIPSLPPPPTL